MFKGQKIIIHPMTPEQIVKDDVSRAAKRARTIDPSPSVNSEIKLNTHVLIATRADFDELCDAHLPCYALVCSSLFVSLDGAPSLDIPPVVANLLQEYADVFPDDLPPGLPPLRGIEHQIDLIPGAQLPNRAPYRTNQRKQRKSSVRSKHYLIRVTFVSLSALVQFLCYLFPRRMDPGVCVSIVELLITSLFVIVILFHVLMIC
jgi:hypothetical protein